MGLPTGTNDTVTVVPTEGSKGVTAVPFSTGAAESEMLVAGELTPVPVRPVTEGDGMAVVKVAVGSEGVLPRLLVALTTTESEAPSVSPVMVHWSISTCDADSPAVQDCLLFTSVAVYEVIAAPLEVEGDHKTVTSVEPGYSTMDVGALGAAAAVTAAGADGKPVPTTLVAKALTT